MGRLVACGVHTPNPENTCKSFRRHGHSGHKEDLRRSQWPQPPTHYRVVHKARSNSVTATFKVDSACQRKFVKTGHRHIRTEEQLNRHHGEAARSPSECQRVLVCDHGNRHTTWIPGRIIRRRGKVFHVIQFGLVKRIRHRKQVRPTESQILPTGPSDLSQEMLLDTFDLGSITENPSAASLDAHLEHGLRPPSWKDGIHKPVRPLQVNHRFRSYDKKFQGGAGRNSTWIFLYRSSQVFLRSSSLSRALLAAVRDACLSGIKPNRCWSPSYCR
ncbi:hypothetical protein CLF_112524 [Clonorchis sinensis]|uniref:Gap-Pol polyprotein n=1 Tax=Clonorchis sinensis TaxID=79923 RepID=G7YWI7_CLOSI|nr:hypothetical protein CLF_112524 [Clonorchis sinensis]